MSDEQAVVNVIHGGSPSESVMEVPLNETSRVTLVEQIKVKYGEHPKRYRNYAILIASFVVYMIVCVCWYTYYEGWDVDISFAFVVETMTTVGMSRLKPKFSFVQLSCFVK